MMGFWCRIAGHQWEMAEGRCEKTCVRCGLVMETPHSWHHCACSHCGALRDQNHDWMYTTECEQVCRVCGKERAEHRWQPLGRGLDKCRNCGKVHKLSPQEIEERDEEWENSGYA